MKKLIIGAVLCCSLWLGAGCSDSSSFNQSRDYQWLIEQYQQDRISEAQYTQLLPGIAK